MDYLDKNVITPEISRVINELRRVRNNVHPYGIIEREYELYNYAKSTNISARWRHSGPIC